MKTWHEQLEKVFVGLTKLEDIQKGDSIVCIVSKDEILSSALKNDEYALEMILNARDRNE